MPTVLRIGGYRFYFFSSDWREPPHVHVDRAGVSAKFWLERLELARNQGMSPRELGIVLQILRERRIELLRGWNEYFGTGAGR